MTHEGIITTELAAAVGRVTGEKWNSLRGIFRPGFDSTKAEARKSLGPAARDEQIFAAFVAGIRETYKPTVEPRRVD